MSWKAMFIVLFVLLYAVSCSPAGPAKGRRASVTSSAALRHPTRATSRAVAPTLRAVSLRALQGTLSTCTPKGRCPSQALAFGGLTRLLGFTLDPARADLVVFGLADPSLPEIRVEDFVVALRASWHRYGHREANVFTYTNPGCDIRPEPDVVLRLNQVEWRLFASQNTGETEAALRAFGETCQLPQRVTVLGVPFDTHFGRVMVAADYAMKSLADGSDDPRLLGFTSVANLERHEAEEAILSHRPLVRKVSQNRFWLTPGPQVYEKGDGILWLRSSPVRILTHKSGATAAGNLVDTTGSDPMAERFAAGFSVLYDEVASERRIYRELRSLFQTFALTQLLHTENAPAKARLRLDYLLDSYPVPESHVARQVPGHHVVGRFQHTEKTPKGSETVQIWLPSCGGVDMQIEPTPDQFRDGRSEVLSSLERALREGWHSSEFARSFSLPHDKEWEMQQSRDLERVNRPDSPVIVRVYDAGSEYHVIFDRLALIYKGLKYSDIVDQIVARMEEQGAETVYVELEGFSDHKAEVFKKEQDLQFSARHPRIAVRYLRDVAGTLTEAALTSPTSSFERIVEPARPVTEGPFKGLHRAVLSFTVRVGREIYRVIMTVFADTAEALDTALNLLGVDSTLVDSVPQSLIYRVERTRRQLYREHGSRAGTLKIQIQRQFSNSHWVDLLLRPAQEAT